MSLTVVGMILMAKWQRIKIPIRKKFKPKERLLIGQEIVDYIVNRTKEGKDKKDRPWSGAAAKYSKSYQNSFEFKVGGKSKNRVNLTLSNEMLNSLKVLKTSKGEITIGFDRSDTENNAKAEGNIRGTYGQKTPIRGKKRDFLGITEKAKVEIQDKYDDTKTDRSVIAERIARLEELLNGSEE